MHLELPDSVSRKVAKLEVLLRDMPNIAVAFSGGVDSSVLLKCAVVNCTGKVTAITAISPSFPALEREAAREFAAALACAYLEIETDEMMEPKYVANQGDRCYYCRRSLFNLARTEIANKRLGTLCYGAIPDDLGDDRPGMQAAEELGVRAPLIESGLSKHEVRAIAKAYGLSVWNKPASACLASRFPTGISVTQSGLSKVEHCERLLAALGFKQFRARYYESLVRIELDAHGLECVRKDPMLRAATEACGISAGFKSAEIDPQGYRMGSVHTPELITIIG